MKARHYAMRFKAPYSALEGVCGVSIFQSGPDVAVVALTEIVGNPGMSVTNAIEHVANKAKRAFLPGVAPDQIIWVERYESTGSVLVDDGIKCTETFDLVTFTIRDGAYVTPSWRSLGNRDGESFWKILFQSDKPLWEFPDFNLAKGSMR